MMMMMMMMMMKMGDWVKFWLRRTYKNEGSLHARHHTRRDANMEI